MMAQAGATVVAVDKAEQGREVAAKALEPFGDRHLVLDADLSDTASVEAMLAEPSTAGGSAARSMSSAE
jgi:NAD(P)-dependent dehydrogenase (short-subunit alcohol dehydrogenase family)